MGTFALTYPLLRFEFSSLDHGQGEDGWRTDIKGPLQEQAWQDREQEKVCLQQEVAMDPGCAKGTEGSEGHRLHGDQEGHSLVRKGQGVLQPVKIALAKT